MQLTPLTPVQYVALLRSGAPIPPNVIVIGNDLPTPLGFVTSPKGYPIAQPQT